ncbi:MAG: type II toxin-antitoxin system death-on-curing family toxin [Egibacteraceae bacterium]
MTVRYLTLEDVVELARRLGVGPIRDLGLLDSAVHRPRSSFFGAQGYPTLELKAAALLQSIAKNHPLLDGNKRLAWLATVVFLDLNGHHPELDRPGAVQLVLDVAKGDLDIEEIGTRLSVTPTG